MIAEPNHAEMVTAYAVYMFYRYKTHNFWQATVTQSDTLQGQKLKRHTKLSFHPCDSCTTMHTPMLEARAPHRFMFATMIQLSGMLQWKAYNSSGTPSLMYDRATVTRYNTLQGPKLKRCIKFHFKPCDSYTIRQNSHINWRIKSNIKRVGCSRILGDV